jgi:hypothetical protein
MNPRQAARSFAQSVMGLLATQVSCRVALCGGPLLSPLLAEFSTLPAFHRIDWPHVHVFATDDRWDESAMDLLSQLPVPRANLVRPRLADVARLDAARDYEQSLRAHFSLACGAIPTFDVLLREAGRPKPGGRFLAGTPAANEVGRLVIAHPQGGLTLSTAVMAAARVRLEVAA